MSEDVFKNVQVLKGIPVNDFMGTMGIFSAALGMSCEDCHRSGDSSWANYATDSPRKQVARSMVVMMATINKTHFGGRQAVTCFSCHRGSDRPKVTPNLNALYDAPPPDDPRDIVEQAKTSPSADEVLNKYIDAVGGAARVASLTSFTARGKSVGYGPDSEERALEIFAKAPNQRTTIVHSSERRQHDDIRRPHRLACRAASAGAGAGTGRRRSRRPSPRRELSFPARIKQAATKWRVGQQTAIDGRDVQVVQGTGAGGVNRDALLRFGERAAGPPDSLRRITRRTYSHAGRLLRLSRCVRREAAVQVEGHVARWPRHDRARARSSQRGDRRALASRAPWPRCMPRIDSDHRT
jgi:hypothetical protein